MDRLKTKIIFDTQEPPDRNGVFDGDSFNELEFKAWLGTVTTWPRLKLRSYNKNSLIYKIKKLRKANGVDLILKHITPTIIEIEFNGKKWVS